MSGISTIWEYFETPKDVMSKTHLQAKQIFSRCSRNSIFEHEIVHMAVLWGLALNYLFLLPLVLSSLVTHFLTRIQVSSEDLKCGPPPGLSFGLSESNPTDNIFNTDHHLKKISEAYYSSTECVLLRTSFFQKTQEAMAEIIRESALHAKHTRAGELDENCALCGMLSKKTRSLTSVAH